MACLGILLCSVNAETTDWTPYSNFDDDLSVVFASAESPILNKDSFDVGVSILFLGGLISYLSLDRWFLAHCDLIISMNLFL